MCGKEDGGNAAVSRQWSMTTSEDGGKVYVQELRCDKVMAHCKVIALERHRWRSGVEHSSYLFFVSGTTIYMTLIFLPSPGD